MSAESSLRVAVIAVVCVTAAVAALAFGRLVAAQSRINRLERDGRAQRAQIRGLVGIAEAQQRLLEGHRRLIGSVLTDEQRMLKLIRIVNRRSLRPPPPLRQLAISN